MSKLAIVAAMEREIRPLIRGWKSREITYEGRHYRVFEGENAAVICGGIGAEAARRATEAIIEEVHPVRVLSVGFAGGLDSKLRVGDVFWPRVVVDAADGSRTDTGCGGGTLVTFGMVADREQKRRLAESYGAAAVDMEAAAVARGAEIRGVQFDAVKVISDDVDFALPATERFVAGDGRFRTAAFAVYVAVRPWLWRSTVVLARNSIKGGLALSGSIANYLKAECGGLANV